MKNTPSYLFFFSQSCVKQTPCLSTFSQLGVSFICKTATSPAGGPNLTLWYCSRWLQHVFISREYYHYQSHSSLQNRYQYFSPHRSLDRPLWTKRLWCGCHRHPHWKESCRMCEAEAASGAAAVHWPHLLRQWGSPAHYWKQLGTHWRKRPGWRGSWRRRRWTKRWTRRERAQSPWSWIRHLHPLRPGLRAHMLEQVSRAASPAQQSRTWPA